MILTLEEAKEALRLCHDEDDEMISNYINSIPDYLETKTGSRWDKEPINPLVKTLAGYLVVSMYEMDSKSYEKLIDNLLMVLTSMVRNKNE
ncbi:MAG: head-tail connector protein [Bacteriophage sp.]|jgi:uncharacterized phage protein (predicted DNA packaging)|nr:MAG: head-tail connector protein [Bacteriophage sp.]